jgi:hypothetical protein
VLAVPVPINAAVRRTDRNDNDRIIIATISPWSALSVFIGIGRFVGITLDTHSLSESPAGAAGDDGRYESST